MSEKRSERPHVVSPRPPSKRKLLGLLFGGAALALLSKPAPAEAKMYDPSSDSAPRVEYAMPEHEMPRKEGPVTFTPRPLDALPGYQDIEGLEYSASNPLTLERIRTYVHTLEDQRARAASDLADMRRVMPEHAPVRIKLQHVVEYYDAMIKKLLFVVAYADSERSLRILNDSRHEQYIKEGALRNMIATKVQFGMSIDDDTRILSLSRKDMKFVQALYWDAHRALKIDAQAGSVYQMDPTTFAWSWKPLETLIPMKAGVSNHLPLSTAYDLSRFQTQFVRQGVRIDPTFTGASKFAALQVTEAWHAGMLVNAGVHKGAGHRLGYAFDLGFVDRNYTPSRVAAVLLAGAQVSGCDLYFETKASPQMRQDIYNELVRFIREDIKNHRDLPEWAKSHTADEIALHIVTKYVRQVRHSTAPYHFHGECSPSLRPVYAPEQRMAGG